MKKIFVISSLIFVAAFGCNKGASLFKFRDSYQAGYEGYFTTVSYSFEYPIDKFIATSDANSKNSVQLQEKSNNNIHSISIFYNGAAGFANSAEYFKEVVKCSDCTESSKIFSVPDAKDMHVYEDPKMYYVVYAHAPGFVVFRLIKPVDEIQKVISTFSISATPETKQTK